MFLFCGGVHQQVSGLVGLFHDAQGGGEGQAFDGWAVTLVRDELISGWHGDQGGWPDGGDGPGEQVSNYVVFSWDVLHCNGELSDALQHPGLSV